MTDKLRAAAEMALEAMQEIDLYPNKVLTASDEEQIDIAITVLIQALEENKDD